MKLVILDADQVIDGTFYEAGMAVVVADGHRAGIRRVVAEQVERAAVSNLARTASATAAPPKPTTLFLSVTVEGQGVVIIEPERKEYKRGEKISLTAKPAEKWFFANWLLADGKPSKDNPLIIALETDSKIVAVFTDKPNGSAGGKHD